MLTIKHSCLYLLLCAGLKQIVSTYRLSGRPIDMMCGDIQRQLM